MYKEGVRVGTCFAAHSPSPCVGLEEHIHADFGAGTQMVASVSALMGVCSCQRLQACSRELEQMKRFKKSYAYTMLYIVMAHSEEAGICHMLWGHNIQLTLISSEKMQIVT